CARNGRKRPQAAESRRKGAAVATAATNGAPVPTTAPHRDTRHRFCQAAWLGAAPSGIRLFSWGSGVSHSTFAGCLLGAGLSRYALPLRFLVISEYGRVIP